MSQTRLIRWFTDSAGAVLLGVGMILLLTNLASLGLTQPRDPIFGVLMEKVFWVCGGLFVMFSLLWFIVNDGWIRLALIFWLAADFLAYQFGLRSFGFTHGLRGYLGGLAEAFGISPQAAEWGLNAVFGYLLLGSCACALWNWMQRMDKSKLKMTCAACGGRISFTANDLGKETTCPHCRTSITARAPGILKMSCFFCKEHIEFPTHALGQKIKCPHCKMDITLKELI